MELRGHQLLAYGLPGLPLAMLGLPLYVYLPTFYSQVQGEDLALVGLVLLLARSADVLTDPLVGWLSDHWPAPLWRRKGPMLIGAVLTVVSAHFLFRPPVEAGAGWLLGWALILYLGWTLVTVPYTAWGAELSDDYHGRSRVTGQREGWVIIGTLLAVVVPTLLGIADDSRATLDNAAISLAILLPITLLICLVGVPESGRTAAATAWKDAWRVLRANRPFLRLLLAYLLNGIANGLPATLFLLFVAQVLQAPDWTGPLLALYFCAGVIGLPLWLGVARLFGKHRAWAASMLAACAAFAVVPLLGTGDLYAFVAVCVISGLSLGADLALSSSLQADVIEWDRRHGGGDRAGFYFGLWGMATKLALALAVGLAFPLLGATGFVAGQVNDQQALLTLSLLYGLVPVVIKLGAVALIWNFPLDEAALDALRRSSTQEIRHDETARADRPARPLVVKRVCRHET